MESLSRRQARVALSDEGDGDLLLYMSLASDDAAGARAAWEEFYRRHAGYLYAVCLRAYAPVLGGEAGASDLVAETFQRAYQKAEKFDADGITDPERMRRRVRAWLGQIARRLAQTALRGRSRLAARSLEQDQWQNVPGRGPTAPLDEDMARRVREAVLALSEREQLVIRTTFQWYVPGRAHQRLPNEVAAELARTLQTTPENLRQIRRRALRKIKATLESPADRGE